MMEVLSQAVFVMLVYLWYMVVVSFFFKQKTAYEMRISDWSSDVCSSDLRAVVLDFPDFWAMLARRGSVVLVGAALTFLVYLTMRPFAQASLARKIGRASCRERVCQYV